MITFADFINIDKIEAEITIRGTIKDFKELQQELGEEYPAWKLSSQITDLVGKLLRTVSPERE